MMGKVWRRKATTHDIKHTTSFCTASQWNYIRSLRFIDDVTADGRRMNSELYTVILSAQMTLNWRAHLSMFLQEQHMAEVQAVEHALEAQREALQELKLESEELYQAALMTDHILFPLTREGPTHTPPKAKYEAPDGKYNNITKVYTQ